MAGSRTESFRMPEVSDRVAGVDVMVEAALQHSDGTGEHMVYPVVVTSTDANQLELPTGNYRVRRRYNAFAFVAKYLQDVHNDCIIPPLPEKKFGFKLSKFAVDIGDESLLRKRRLALRDFILRVVSHPTLGRDKGFHAFLTEAEDWQSHLRVVGQDGVTLQPYAPSNFSEMFKGSSMSTANSAREYRDLFNYADQLQEHLASLLSIHGRLAGTTEALVGLYADLEGVVGDWQKIEQGLSDVLFEVSLRFAKLSQRTEKRLKEEETFADNIKVFAGFSESLRRLALNQQRLQQRVTKARSLAEAKEQQRHNFLNPEQDSSVRGFFSRLAGPSSEKGMKDKEEQLTTQLNALKEDAARLEGQHEDFLTVAAEEVKRFHADKRRCMLTMFLAFATIQKAYAEAHVRMWNRLHHFLAVAASEGDTGSGQPSMASEAVPKAVQASKPEVQEATSLDEEAVSAVPVSLAAVDQNPLDD
eukprot:m.144448 g.144448  ORF g.144448 m.144448 type:complete len:473 (-) comp16197_c0_seq1:1962-3380(-)